ncbi:VOC family protein [Plastoroseomonas arctica]|uniref:Glyoxalase n=1 Tax=Plastoroseomonas arctica TaxID=1509237 RepID=A0AAF1KM73_9PROT|nr:VOC family protein [Plastoroseomonas arctica]MBR0655916.1 glyoxalase [Plastoroseomonas arctica]
MTVLRIVANLAARAMPETRDFYVALFGLEVVMDQGWIVTLASGETARVQMSIASEGGSGTPVPDISIEVDDVDAIHARARELGAEIAYDLTDEPWGVRRFFIRAPDGALVNVLSHASHA